VNTHKIVQELDAEIARLTSARNILNGSTATNGSARLAKSVTATKPSQPKRHGITAAGRKRLSLLMKKRWAERRKRAASK
jgi:hypothetical protein